MRGGIEVEEWGVRGGFEMEGWGVRVCIEVVCCVLILFE